MPSARFRGPAQTPPTGSRVFVVIATPDGSRVIAEVQGAEVSISREYPDVAWWQGDAFSSVPSFDTIDLHGSLGTQRAYTGDVPPEQREVDPVRRAIDGMPRSRVEPGA